MTGRDAEREQLAAALYGDDEAAEYLNSPRLLALLPVVDRIANQRAAAELRNAAEGISGGASLTSLPVAVRQALGIAVAVVRARADELVAS